MSTTFFRGENPLKADKLNTAFAERVSRGGDTMQGMLKLAADPVAAFDAATKQYVDRFTSVGVPTGAYIGAAPPGNTLGPLWWDTNSGQLFIQYNDGTSTQWVSANSIADDPAPKSINVMNYGARGDGIANDTAAFNAAIGDAYNTKANLVLIPSGKYLLDPLMVSPGVVLQGMVPGPLDPPIGGPSFLTQPIGATLLVNSHSASFIQLNTSCGLFDVIIYDPNQVAPTAMAPNVFPAMIRMQAPSRMRGVTLVNAYIGVEVRSGRSIIEDCYIGAYKTCVDTDEAADTIYFRNIWCGVFYDTAMGLFPWQNMDNWVINNNTVAFKFGRADAVSMVNCGCYIKWAGMFCADGAVDSLPAYGWVVNFDADMCVYGAVIYTANAANGWQLSNFTALPVMGGPAPAATPLYMPPGGSSPPIVHWSGGSIGLGLPNYWSASQQPIVNSGQLSVRGVSQLPDRMLSGLGVFGHAPVMTKPTVSGAKSGNAALASLLTALSNYGFITDSTT